MENAENLERVEAVENTIDVFENDIVMYLKMFCEEYDIQDLKKESQSVWNGMLRYIKKHVFKDKSKLKDKSNINIYNNNIPSNCNRYNYSLVNDICDIYIDLCLLYDKEVSIIGFSNITGIDYDTIYSWNNNNSANSVNNVSKTGMIIYKKLNQFREESLSNKLATGNKNPVGILAILNRHYQWNLPGVSKENSKQQVLSVEQLPDLKQIEANEKLDK